MDVRTRKVCVALAAAGQGRRSRQRVRSNCFRRHSSHYASAQEQLRHPWIVQYRLRRVVHARLAEFQHEPIVRYL